MSNNVPSTSLVCFIVCDGGPAAHFAAFATNLFHQNELQIIIYATGPALTKLKDSHLPNDIQLLSFSIENFDHEQQEQVATQLIDNCLKQGTRTIIVDIGNKFDRIFQAVSSKRNIPNDIIHFWCYYDNPEPYVPGGYSIKTEETIKSSQYILFANINLAKSNSIIYSLPEKRIDLTNKIVEGIGYYPVIEVEKLLQQREIEKDSLRAHYGWTNIQHLFVYFGGNNDTYFDQAFPTFLSNLSHIDKNIVQDVLFLLHQHPAAKKQNRDGLLFQECLSKNNHIQGIISTLRTSDQAQIVADAALYYQTSMAPQFVLLGLPTMQVGHETYHDVLVKFNLCYTATNATELVVGLTQMKERSELSDKTQQRKELIYNAIGYTPDWPNNLHRIIFDYK
ncbi:unnamed protein product [Rotaria sp. Silwood2]|nr:unnamed protein product [Rotaria sp. Silwood2]CAF2949431.1 unnamed protein product [Rotaria sp. Silwood2]CAF4381814.1 unnamed protein product [Rotaria sp. Silwood2]CAF4470136.1 unnamed protein product [Rotaria sp. Silwood2]CAF4648258.1 unnamed protein product [Rotaria sp. Silwood2]